MGGRTLTLTLWGPAAESGTVACVASCRHAIDGGIDLGPQEDGQSR
jgi:hypothetical protein